MNLAGFYKALPAFHCFLIAVAFSLAAVRFFILDSHDRYKCHALLNNGKWLDAGLSSTDALNNWQPDGCMLNSYTEKTGKSCFSGRQIVFAGDSTVRQLYYATAKILDQSLQVPDFAPEGNAAGQVDLQLKHQDVSILAGGANLRFFWDPYLNGSKTDNLFRNPKGNGKSAQIPSLVVIGTGLWHLRNPSSGGFKAWSSAIDKVFAATIPSHIPIADEVVLLPIQHVIQDKLSADRKLTLTNSEISLMNADLAKRLPPFSSSTVSQLSVPYCFNDMLQNDQAPAHTVDGLHFDANIVKAQANIILNLRCNDILPKQFPFDKTCCNQYPAPNWLQAIILLVVLVWAPVGTHYYASKNTTFYSRILPPQHILAPLTVFGFSIIFMYFCDRTSLFLKVQKQFDFWQYTIAMILAAVLGASTLKKPEKDLGFLNRDQTDEWKGWMQIAILIYHYYGASKISGIYNPIRVLVAAYLFMSGYGHFTFYYKKADFGLARVAAVLVRLNLLTIVLTYVQDTDYLSYYFSPLTTLWFGVIWVTMYIGNPNNKRTWFMLGKIGLSAGLMATFHLLNWPLAALFAVYNTLFGTSWNAREWTFRVTLDLWIVYVGMLAAFLVIRLSEVKIWERSWWKAARQYSIGAAAVIMIGYFYFELCLNKLEYNVYHPYISMLPVLAFCVLRNATPFLRSTSSKAYIWIGQCSLETFICQFHLWLGADTKGLLVLFPISRFRFANMVFSTLIFLFLSNQIAIATGDLTDWICGKAPKVKASALPISGTGEAYMPLSQVSGEEASGPNGDATGELKGIPPAAVVKAPISSTLASAMLSLPARCAFIMGLVWIINILYPAAHPSQGHLLPTH